MSHDHPHDQATDEGPPSEHEILSRALQELLEEKGVLTAEQVRKRMELFEAQFPQRGARVIAHAWANPAFRKRLLADGKAACAEWGLDLEADRLIAVENTPRVHNVIVCTLCSCYPRALLGMPPTWYKSENYRRREAEDRALPGCVEDQLAVPAGQVQVRQAQRGAHRRATPIIESRVTSPASSASVNPAVPAGRCGRTR